MVSTRVLRLRTKRSTAWSQRARSVSLLRIEGRKAAIPALLAIFDREDSLGDLHPNSRGRITATMAARPYPPPERDNLAYMADRALTRIVGEDPQSIPPYTSKDVLEKRKEHWRTRIGEK